MKPAARTWVFGMGYFGYFMRPSDLVKQEWTMDDQMGSDTPKKGRWQHQLHTWAR
jgi:hypothetical protein